MAEVAAIRTPVAPADFFRALAAVVPDASSAALAVLGAMWGLETGNGQNMYNWNPGNIMGPEPHMVLQTSAGPLSFRAFRSLDEGLRAWVSFFRSRRYSSAWNAALAGDLAGFTEAALAAGYIGLPPNPTEAAQYRAGMRARYAQLAKWVPAGIVAGMSTQKALVIGGVGVGIAGALAWWLTSGRYRIPPVW